MNVFDGVKVFAATKARERAGLDVKVNQWLAANAATIDLVDIIVRQSSDEAFHCLSIVVFYTYKSPKK